MLWLILRLAHNGHIESRCDWTLCEVLWIERESSCASFSLPMITDSIHSHWIDILSSIYTQPKRFGFSFDCVVCMDDYYSIWWNRFKNTSHSDWLLELAVFFPLSLLSISFYISICFTSRVLFSCIFFSLSSSCTKTRKSKTNEKPQAHTQAFIRMARDDENIRVSCSTV